MATRRFVWRGLTLFSTVLFVACGAGTESESTSDNIVNGQPLPTYPEAGVLNIDVQPTQAYICSAALIAPKVVLTAGHCVSGHTRWDFYLGSTKRTSTRSALYDWVTPANNNVDPQRHDIGLVFLDEAISLSYYPTLATQRVQDGTRVLNVGRILNGTITQQLYGAETTVSDGSRIGYPFAYQSASVIEPGDSGGPDFLAGTHQIVAVNSGANTQVQVLARVDLVYSWIKDQINSHGGFGAAYPTTTDAGVDVRPDTPADTKVDTGTSVAPDTGSASHADAAKPSDAAVDGRRDDAATATTDPTLAMPACAATEQEPNDRASLACRLATSQSVSGTVSAGNDDWYVVPAGTRLDLQLQGSADVSFSVGTWSNGTCTPDLIDLRVLSSTFRLPEASCIRVSSSTAAAVSYLLTRSS